jgi:hypothetical protein
MRANETSFSRNIVVSLNTYNDLNTNYVNTNWHNNEYSKIFVKAKVSLNLTN